MTTHSYRGVLNYYGCTTDDYPFFLGEKIPPLRGGKQVSLHRKNNFLAQKNCPKHVNMIRKKFFSE
jgi:hypothetical protein